MNLISCEFDAAVMVGASTARIEIDAGDAEVSGLTIYGEPCIGYEDTYSDTYNDPTEGGTIPGAQSNAVEYQVLTLPAGSTLKIDGVQRTVSLVETDGGAALAGIEAITFEGILDFLSGSGGACLTVAVQTDGATLNAASRVRVYIARREG